MTTITVDILDDRAYTLLKDMETYNLIRLHPKKNISLSEDSIKKYSGAITKQPIDEIDKKLNELRHEWSRNF